MRLHDFLAVSFWELFVMEFVGCDLPIQKLEEMIFRTSTKQSVRIVQGQKFIVFGFLLSFHKTETKTKAVVVLS